MFYEGDHEFSYAFLTQLVKCLMDNITRTHLVVLGEGSAHARCVNEQILNRNVAHSMIYGIVYSFENFIC